MAPTSERLFVDLIARATHKYPNWDPEVPIEPGDYGRVTGGQKGAFWKRRRLSGTFLKEGNIYTEGLAQKYDIPEPVEYGAESTQGTTWITSRNAQQVTWDADIQAGHNPALAECSIKASFKFSTGQGAVLAMDNDTVLAVNPAGKLLRLLADKALPDDSVIVSEVHRCSSYARFLSSNHSTSVTLGLRVQPIVMNTAPGKGNIEAKWVHDATAGNFKGKMNKDGKRVFYPLFRLVSLEEESLSTGLTH